MPCGILFVLYTGIPWELLPRSWARKARITASPNTILTAPMAHPWPLRRGAGQRQEPESPCPDMPTSVLLSRSFS